MRGQYLLDRIAAVKLQIEAAETAIIAVTTGSVLSYTIDTGQTRQTVTKQTITSVQNSLEGLYNLLATLEARAGCGGSVYVRPAF